MNANTPPIKPSPLGRGLSALFGDADASYSPQLAAAINQKQAPPPPPRMMAGAPLQMPLAWLQPGKFQPRRAFHEEALAGLTDSIRARGILEPLVIRPLISSAGKPVPERFEIIAGERRWRAAQAAGVHNVPVVVRTLTDLEALEFGLIENVQRQDLSPLEEAEGYQRLLEEFDHTLENLAKIVGKSRPHISNLLRVLSLPPAVKTLIEAGKLTIGHARAVVTAKDPLALALEIVRKGLNVRQAEALAKRVAEAPSFKAKKPIQVEAADADVQALEKELERVIGLRVKIETKGKAGSLSLFYHDLDQLDEIIRKLRA